MPTTRIKKQAPAILGTGAYTLRYFALGNLEFIAALKVLLGEQESS
jgi:hypothetical protein